MSLLFNRLIARRNGINFSILRTSSNTLNLLMNKLWSSAPNIQNHQEIINPKQNELITNDIISKVSRQLENNEQGRMFAIVHVAGKQFKITPGDLIVIEGYWPPDVGDKINLNKVLVLGSKDFSLIGRPIIERGLVDIHATIIEKTLSHTKTNFKKKRRKQYTNINFYKIPQTTLRINDIVIIGKLNEPPDVMQLDYTTSK